MKWMMNKRSFSTKITKVVPWEAGDVCKQLIGPRTVIVSMNDDRSKEMAQRMWFEMQRCGIQSTFITTNTPYPTLSNIQESVSLFRRTGAKSIITLGTGSISDYGKAIRGAVEAAMPINQFYKLKNSNYAQRENISLLCFGSTPSPVHYLPSFQVLHPEDDILVTGVGRNPEVVGFGSSLSMISPYQDVNIGKAYLASFIFDSVFTLAYSKLYGGNNVNATTEFVHSNINKFHPLKIKSLLTDSSIRVDNFLDNNNKFIEAVENVSRIRNHIQYEIVKPDINCWPGINEMAAMLSSLNPKQEQLLPFSFHAVRSFNHLVDKVIPAADQYFREQDKKVIDALTIAVAITTEMVTTESTTDALVKLTANAVDSTSTQINKHPKLFSKKLKESNEALTSAGHLEKILIPLDLEIEQAGGSLPGCELRKTILQGDVMVDLVEGVI